LTRAEKQENPVVPTLKDFTDAMSASWPVALAICIGASAVLVGEHFQIRYLTTLPEWLLGTAFLVTVFSGAVVVVALAQWAINLMARPFRRLRAERWKSRHLEELQALPPQEGYILAWAAQQNTQVFLAPYNDQLIEPLIAKSFVEIIPGTHSILDWPHRIPDHIWAAMREWIATYPPDRQLERPFRW
jgi:hypothetical protein